MNTTHKRKVIPRFRKVLNRLPVGLRRCILAGWPVLILIILTIPLLLCSPFMLLIRWMILGTKRFSRTGKHWAIAVRVSGSGLVLNVLMQLVGLLRDPPIALDQLQVGMINNWLLAGLLLVSLHGERGQYKPAASGLLFRMTVLMLLVGVILLTSLSIGFEIL